jgi:hypothetical protein
MLQVVLCIGGGVAAFIAMMVWANNGRLRSENETEDGMEH